MHFSFILLTLCHLSWGFPLDTIIQIQHSGVVGREETVDQVLVNGVSLGSGEVDSIIRTISTDAPLRMFTFEVLEKVNQTTLSRNHTLLRLRECKLDASRVHLTDRILYDGKIYLTLDQTSHTWTAHALQARALKRLWDQEPERTRKETVQLQEGCLKLMKVVTVPEGHLGMQMTSVLAPVIALLVFMGMFLISFFISKKQGSWHPGGVIGSIIHYPTDSTEMPQGTKHSRYQAL